MPLSDTVKRKGDADSNPDLALAAAVFLACIARVFLFIIAAALVSPSLRHAAHHGAYIGRAKEK